MISKDQFNNLTIDEINELVGIEILYKCTKCDKIIKETSLNRHLFSHLKRLTI